MPEERGLLFYLHGEEMNGLQCITGSNLGYIKYKGGAYGGNRSILVSCRIF